MQRFRARKGQSRGRPSTGTDSMVTQTLGRLSWRRVQQDSGSRVSESGAPKNCVFPVPRIVKAAAGTISDLV